MQYVFAEMPASGNLKCGDSLFLHNPPLPPSNISDQPSPDPDPDPPDKRELLRTLYEVLHEVQTITIHFHDNLCQ